MKREQRNSLILAAALFAVLGVAFLVQRFLLHGPDGPTAWAVVQVAGQEPQQLDLSRDMEFRVGNNEIGYNLVQVEGGKITTMAQESAEAVDWLTSIGAPLPEVAATGGTQHKYSMSRRTAAPWDPTWWKN